MTKLLKSAVRGERKAMNSLYEANKEKVFRVAQKLLLEDEKAAEAAQWVWENIWTRAEAAGTSTEEEFTLLAVKMTADICKEYIEEKSGQDFSRQQKEMNRWILVLHKVGGMSKMQLAIYFRNEQNAIQNILDEEDSVTDDDAEDMPAEEKPIDIPENIEKAAKSVMNEIAVKAEAKDKVRDNVNAVLLLAAGVLVLIFVFFGDNIKTALLGEAAKGTETTTETEVADELGNGTGESVETETVPEVTLEDIAEAIGISLVDENLTYYADIEIENYGKIVIELNQKEAPITVANFVDLAESGFYDGLTFHRIMKGYMMQGGDPYGNGTGGSGRPIVGEFKDNGYNNNLLPTRGAIAMARSDIYDSASSQFFIVQEDYLFWYGYYAVFGYVTEGIEIVDQICNAAEPKDANGLIAGEDQPVMTSVTIRTEAKGE